MKKSRIGFITVLLFFVLRQASGAAILQVPADYPSIMAAIVAAADGDEVVVSPGTYYEHNINFQNKTLILRSIDPEDRAVVESTIIDGEGKGSVFNLYMSADNATTIAGFTITHGHAGEGMIFGGGISCHGTSPTIAHNIIHDNSAMYGGGIYCYESTAVIVNNTILGNYAQQLGGGIHSCNSTVEIRDNTITGNQSIFYGGGISAANGAGFDPPIIESNIITLNRSGHGAGIHCYDAIILNNDISNNLGEPDGPCGIAMGGGIYGTPSVVTGNTISNNEADWGGGMDIIGNTAEITENSISNNTAEFEGGGIHVRSGVAPVVEHNMILGNQSAIGGGVFCYSGVFSNNVIAANECFSDDPEIKAKGGGIYLADVSECNEPSPILVNNTFDGNSADDGGNIYVAISSPTIQNCVITHAPSGGGIFWNEISSDGYQPDIAYCDLFQNQGDNYVGMSDLTGSNGNISADPLFADPAAHDYHLLSEGGRWFADNWVEDDTTSPCIDQGDPLSDYGLEPAPNGHRINMGAFGNTLEASKSNSSRTIKILVYEIAEWVHPILIKAYPDTVYVETAVSEKQVVQALVQKPFDAVLIDVDVPDQEGLNTAAYIYETQKTSQYRDIIVIGFSKNIIKGETGLILKTGMDDFVSAPDAKKLMDVIKKQLESQ